MFRVIELLPLIAYMILYVDTENSNPYANDEIAMKSWCGSVPK